MRPILSSFANGVKNVWTNKFLIGIMYVFELIFSFILLFPLYIMFSASFATNVKASNFLKWFDLSLIIDFVYFWKKTLSIYFFIFILICFIAVLVFIFLSGGFWGVLRDRIKRREEYLQMNSSKTRLESFFGYCGKYFWGMFKIALMLIPFYLMAFLLFLILATVFGALAGKGSLLQITSWRTIAKILIGVVLFFGINMVSDYLKIIYIENYGERFFKVVQKAFKFLLTNLFYTLSLYYVLSVILVVAILFCLGLNAVIGKMPGTGFSIFVAFVIQQIFVIFRSFYRLVYYSSEVILYEKLSSKEIEISQQT
jgi:hypothetical protein